MTVNICVVDFWTEVFIFVAHEYQGGFIGIEQRIEDVYNLESVVIIRTVRFLQ